ncbi:DUF6904 family protein [Bacillus weihaiensis]|uniref:Uncharacterized protein n=1 Tax=Bacillus weihaiensis TaxID=1547283 RepID=A0A1L3MMF9_9BACI|nr:hypothetical protein [Bacillus weihaiensis]APH03529.1 hypothetical protein A9C19_01490 [Bacillus weihaiensis]
MLKAKATPNFAGITLSGDRDDFEGVYEALHKIVGEEGEYEHVRGSRLRVLGVCYDIRHAMMGNREIELVDNGMDPDKMKWFSTITSEKNVYMSVNLLWPEILFVMMALNDFTKLYATKESKKSYQPFEDYRVIWDQSLIQVRLFQSVIAECLKETVTDAAYSRTLKTMNGSYFETSHYKDQYVDMLNLRFIEMDSEKRKKNITIMAKRLAEKGTEYQTLERKIEQVAEKHGCSVDEVRFSQEYPEEIDW